ncbi:hypothetical protein SQ01_04565 [Moraxella catarrhalis]|nr:hypothetical protein SQ01_04565 [Moraxella catarrhalis]
MNEFIIPNSNYVSNAFSNVAQILTPKSEKSLNLSKKVAKSSILTTPNSQRKNQQKSVILTTRDK